MYCRFVPNFAHTASQLMAILKKGKPTKFGNLSERAHAAFVQLKSKVASPRVLSMPRHSSLYVLETDACDSQVGCVLIQPDDKRSLRPFNYWSQILCSAERNNDMTERERLAIVWDVLLV